MGAAEVERVLATRVEPEMAEQIAALAKANDRSIAAELRLAIRAHVESEESAA